MFTAEGAEKDFNSKRDKLRKDYETKLSELNNEKKNIQNYKDQIVTLQNQVPYFTFLLIERWRSGIASVLLYLWSQVQFPLLSLFELLRVKISLQSKIGCLKLGCDYFSTKFARRTGFCIIYFLLENVRVASSGCVVKY